MMKRYDTKKYYQLTLLAILIALFAVGAYFKSFTYDADGKGAVVLLTASDDIDGSIVMFGSDFQSSARENNFKDIMAAAKAVQPSLFVFGGDYQTSFLVEGESDKGIDKIKKTIRDTYQAEIPALFAAGNHDPSDTKQLAKTGAYAFKNFIVYTINEDDFTWNQGSHEESPQSRAQKTARDITGFLRKANSDGETRPIFIVTHVPLHYSDRSDYKDNQYAPYLFKAINKNAGQLDVVFLFGHNHSGHYDDYIGGAVNLLTKGSIIHVGGTDAQERLNFTYMNCGYIGYSNNAKSDTSTNVLSVTAITVKDKALEIQKYTKDGPYYPNAVVVERIVPVKEAVPAGI